MKNKIRRERKKHHSGSWTIKEHATHTTELHSMGNKNLKIVGHIFKLLIKESKVTRSREDILIREEEGQRKREREKERERKIGQEGK